MSWDFLSHRDVNVHSTDRIREGFQVKQSSFAMPQDSTRLKPEVKRALTICNLFCNHQLDIADIARVLDESVSRVIQVLIQQGLIHDRRKGAQPPPVGFDRRRRTA
ncbi:MAG: hypothetical protein AB1898_18845 [Acidobacteriota bacterium]